MGLVNLIDLTLLLVTYSFAPLVQGNPVELGKRLTCYHDNCLRALLANSGPASKFCPAYLQNSTPRPTATYTSLCTENPTAVASACSCFESTSTTSTTTTTSTSGTPTPTQCSAANKYGYVYKDSAFDFKSQYIYFNGQYMNGPQGSCCTKCFSMSNCYSFMEDYIAGSEPPEVYCEIGFVATGTWPDVSPQCPSGIATGPYPGELPLEPSGVTTGGSGLGPCGAG